MKRLHAKYHVWVEHNDVNKAIDYIIESAKSVGVEVIPRKTALSMQFMEKVMRGLRERAERIRAETMSEVKRNPNLIEIPEGATNGDMIKAVFPNYEIETKKGVVWVHRLGFDGGWQRFSEEWWNSPYRKEQE